MIIWAYYAPPGVAFVELCLDVKIVLPKTNAKVCYLIKNKDRTWYFVCGLKASVAIWIHQKKRGGGPCILASAVLYKLWERCQNNFWYIIWASMLTKLMSLSLSIYSELLHISCAITEWFNKYSVIDCSRYVRTRYYYKNFPSLHWYTSGTAPKLNHVLLKKTQKWKPFVWNRQSTVVWTFLVYTVEEHKTLFQRK